MFVLTEIMRRNAATVGGTPLFLSKKNAQIIIRMLDSETLPLENSAQPIAASSSTDEDTAGIVSSGQKARAADVTEALAAVRALQDAQRKERQEADELEHSK